MTKEEQALVASLGLALIQTNLEFAFYKKKSGLGDIPSTGHPDFDALKRPFAPLIAGLEKSIVQTETPAGDLYRLLQEALTKTGILRQS